jgi:hypothetical protein
MDRTSSTNREKNTYAILVGKPQRKRLLAKPRLIGWIIMEWILEKLYVVVWI